MFDFIKATAIKIYLNKYLSCQRAFFFGRFYSLSLLCPKAVAEKQSPVELKCSSFECDIASLRSLCLTIQALCVRVC